MNKIILPCVLLLSLLSPAIAAEPSTKSSLAVKKLLTDIVQVADKMVAVGERGHILYSSDGQTWQQANVPVNVLLTDVFFLTDSHGWAVGHDATILTTNDGGLNWQLQLHQPKRDKPLFGVYFKDNNNGIAVGAYGMFFRTQDGGKSWQYEFHDEFLHPDDRDYLNELKAEDVEAYESETRSILPHFNRIAMVGDTLYLVGEIGLVAKSKDFGRQFEKLPEFYNGSFFDIASFDGHTVLIGGLRGNFFTSVDGGEHWQKVDLDGATSINRIVSNGKALVLLGNSGLMQVSFDGGKHFQSRQQSDGKAISGGVFKDGKLVLSSEVGIKTITLTQGGN